MVSSIANATVDVSSIGPIKPILPSFKSHHFAMQDPIAFGAKNDLSLASQETYGAHLKVQNDSITSQYSFSAASGFPIASSTFYAPLDNQKWVARKSGSFPATTYCPKSTSHMTSLSKDYSNNSSLYQPNPLRRSSLITLESLEPLPFGNSRINTQEKSSMAFSTSSSLAAQSPPQVDNYSSKFKLIAPSPAMVELNNISKVPTSPESDPLLLLHFLTQVDLSKFGYQFKEIEPIKKAKRSASSIDSFSRSASDEYSRIEIEFMDAVKRKHRLASSPDIPSRTSKSAPSTPRHRGFSINSFNTPKTQTTNSVPSSPNLEPKSPRVPYKGKFGLHPTCGSCKTMRTPYWRDSWSDSFILCNACGLRYSKFKKYCHDCSYVPRKEDKEASCCPLCSSTWSYKS